MDIRPAAYIWYFISIPAQSWPNTSLVLEIKTIVLHRWKCGLSVRWVFANSWSTWDQFLILILTLTCSNQSYVTGQSLPGRGTAGEDWTDKINRRPQTRSRVSFEPRRGPGTRNSPCLQQSGGAPPRGRVVSRKCPWVEAVRQRGISVISLRMINVLFFGLFSVAKRDQLVRRSKSVDETLLSPSAARHQSSAGGPPLSFFLSHLYFLYIIKEIKRRIVAEFLKLDGIKKIN